MASSVVECLKQTPKGQLRYGCPLSLPSSTESSFSARFNDSFRISLPESSFWSSPRQTSGLVSPSSSISESEDQRPDLGSSTAPALRSWQPLRDAIPEQAETDSPSSAGPCLEESIAALLPSRLADGGDSDDSLRSADVIPLPVHDDPAVVQRWAERARVRRARKRDQEKIRLQEEQKLSKAKAQYEGDRELEFRRRQEKTQRRLEEQEHELTLIEQQVEYEDHAIQAEYERKDRENKELAEREQLQVEEQQKRLEAARRKAVEEELLKRATAAAAAALATRCKTLEEVLSGCSEQKYLPQPGTQQLLEKLRIIAMVAAKLAQSPYVGAEAELRKLPSSQELDQAVQDLVTAARRVLEEEKQRMLEQEKKRVEAQAASSQPTVPASAAASGPAVKTPTGSPVKTTAQASSSSSSSSDAVVPAIWRGCLTPASCQRYLQLATLLSNTEETLAQFKADTQQKPYRDLLARAVVTAVNTVSSQSAQHMLDKIARMLDIVSGKTVTLGTKTVSASQHKDAKLFCTHVLAHHIVMQGEKQIASHAESAFPFAAIVLGVWDKCALFGDLFLAHLYRSCPVAVPFYPSRLQGQSETDYLRSLGFRFKDNAPETNDQFDTRMAGFMRLYAAVLQASPPPGVQQNPHGIGHCWIWLARVLNLEPRPSVTATAICAVFEMAGHALKSAYRSQLDHLLRLMALDFLPKVEKVTPQHSQGPLARLRQSLEEVGQRSGRFNLPEGHLAPAYWTSRDYDEPTVEQLITGTAFANYY